MEQNFSIRRDPQPIIFRIIGLVFFTDMFYMLYFVILAVVKNSLSLDLSFFMISVVLFIARSIFVIYWLVKLTKRWFKIKYYVLGGEIVIDSHSRSHSSRFQPLKNLNGISVEKPGWFNKRFNYGVIKLDFLEDDSKKRIVLYEVSKPKEVAQKLVQISEKYKK